MASARHTEIVENLKAAVDAFLQDVKEFGEAEEHGAQVVDAVRVVFEDGLEGNRSLRPFIWSLVRRVGKAYPVTFHPSIDRVRALARQDSLSREQVEDAWIKQALHEGVLSSLLRSVIRQFQIRSAYLSEAVICDKVCRSEISKTVDKVKGHIQPVPDAPSVSSWSSDDSFVYTPRSTEADESLTSTGRHSRPAVRESDRYVSHGTVSGSVSEDGSRTESRSRHTSMDSNDHGGQLGRATVVLPLPPQSTSSGGKCSVVSSPGIGHPVTEITIDDSTDKGAGSKPSLSEESMEIKTPDRLSFFGRISRNLSGSLHHTVTTDALHRDNQISELTREEQTSRFWSRQRSGSGSTSSLLREVEKDIGAGIATPVTAEERARASRLLVKELNKVARLVLQQHCSNGYPLSVELYPLTKMVHLYEEAFEIGLRPCPLFQPTVPDMYLSDFEKIVPAGAATPYSVLVGIQAIYPHEQLGVVQASDSQETGSVSKFQDWLKRCLIDSCLGERIETVLEHQDFLQGWYYPQAIVTNEDLVQEIIATCRGLDAIAVEEANERKKDTLSKKETIPEASSEQGNAETQAVVEEEKEASMSSGPLSPDVIDTKPVEASEDCETSSQGCSGQEWTTTQGIESSLVGTLARCVAVQDVASVSDHVHSHLDQPNSAPASTDRRHRSHQIRPHSGVSSPAQNVVQRSWSLSNEIHENSSSFHDLPVHQQISIVSAKSGKLRLGESTRSTFGTHQRTTSVVSSCISGEEEDDWRGVWKDVDVVRHETRSSPQGEMYVTYIIELMASDGTHWQTARRFSDLVSLNKTLIKQEVELPHSWTNLLKARVVTGRKRYSNEIIDARSALIRQCLWDLMAAFPESLIWTSVAQFLDAPLSLLRGTKSRQRSGVFSDERVRNLIFDRIQNHLGRMALIVDLPVPMSDEVLFEMQKGLCAGCQAYLPSVGHQKSMFRSSISPRKCQYTELLYCHKCHQLDSAYLPSRVMHCWDFGKYSVSVGAKSYLYSMFPSPVLCVNAVNPGLLASVPTLAHMEHLRQNIVKLLRQLKAKGPEGKRIALSIEENAGMNKHLLQNADYWSLRDLGDVSRGVFARLPRWLEAVNKQIEKVVELHVN